MCDVGQGDAFLITQGFNQMLVDTGLSEEKLSQCLSEHIPFWDRQLEYLLITHDDNDHDGAKEYVESSFLVTHLIDHQFILDNPDSVASNSAHQAKKIQISPQISFEILWPAANLLQASPISDNDSSLVTLLHLGAAKVLLTGDIEQEVEQALLEAGLITDIDVLKVSHHGSKSSSSPPFLKESEPEECLISVGENNSYGHPHQQTLSNLELLKCDVHRTDTNGEVELVSDGNKYWFSDD